MNYGTATSVIFSGKIHVIITIVIIIKLLKSLYIFSSFDLATEDDACSVETCLVNSRLSCPSLTS